jgi:hypothetical protein
LSLIILFFIFLALLFGRSGLISTKLILVYGEVDI